jgi:hypothetical protein
MAHFAHCLLINRRGWVSYYSNLSLPSAQLNHVTVPCEVRVNAFTRTDFVLKMCCQQMADGPLGENLNSPRQELCLTGCLPRWTLFRSPSVLPALLPRPPPSACTPALWTWAAPWSTKKYSDTINTNPNKYSEVSQNPSLASTSFTSFALNLLLLLLCLPRCRPVLSLSRALSRALVLAASTLPPAHP